MAIVLFAVYVALSFVNDDRGTLGTDTGGKVATLHTMSVHGEGHPDVGYWAEKWDPQGDLHPLYYTSHVNGRWLQVTTVPVLYAALPLYDLWGYRGALVLPMLGGVAAALAARALAQRLGARRPWTAFWVVGLASPLTIYSVDFWEHSIGVALLLWAAVAAFDAVERDSRFAALAAGALVGGAFLLRTEALVYGAIGGLVVVALLFHRRRQWPPILRFGALFAVGGGLVVGLGALLELATVGRLLRLSRAGYVASGAGAEAVPGSRVDDAIATTVNLRPSLDAGSYIAGVAVVVLVVVVVVLARRHANGGEGRPLAPSDARVLVGFGILIGALYLVRFSEGLGFVPGLFAATPIAAVALADWGAPARRVVGAVALAALPFMWIFEFVGGATPQWGGRYQLPTTMLLLVIGLLALESLPRGVAAGLVVLSLAVTVFGALWLRERSHSIADAMVGIERLPQPALVSDVAHLFREGGAFYDRDHHWLTAVTPAQQDRAAQIVREAGFDEFGFIALATDAPRQFAGFRAGATQTVRLFSDVALRVTTYDATGP